MCNRQTVTPTLVGRTAPAHIEAVDARRIVRLYLAAGLGGRFCLNVGTTSLRAELFYGGLHARITPGRYNWATDAVSVAIAGGEGRLVGWSGGGGRTLRENPLRRAGRRRG